MGKEKEDKEEEMASPNEEGSLVPGIAIENQNQQTGSKKGGGWVTAPFILGSSLASSVAAYGVTIDLMQFLVRRFNISNIRASQITNIINSFTSLSPVAGAILCDSHLGCFLTISLFTSISFLGILMLALAASLTSLAPPSCDHQLGSCQPPTPTQFGFLCFAFSVTTLGAAGTCFTYVTIGANQFDRKMDQERFVSYYFFTTTISTLVPPTVIVYVMDNVGWNWGYGLCAVLSTTSLVLFLPAKWCCRDARPEGSPFVNLARVVVSAARKIKIRLSGKEEDYYIGSGKPSELTSGFSFINKAALITGGDTHLDGSIGKRWRLCLHHPRSGRPEDSDKVVSSMVHRNLPQHRHFHSDQSQYSAIPDHGPQFGPPLQDSGSFLPSLLLHQHGHLPTSYRQILLSILRAPGSTAPLPSSQARRRSHTNHRRLGRHGVR